MAYRRANGGTASCRTSSRRSIIYRHIAPLNNFRTKVQGERLSLRVSQELHRLPREKQSNIESGQNNRLALYRRNPALFLQLGFQGRIRNGWGTARSRKSDREHQTDLQRSCTLPRRSRFGSFSKTVSSTRRQYASTTFGFSDDSPLVTCISGPNSESVAVRLTIM
jgi:hypothetical protein